MQTLYNILLAVFMILVSPFYMVKLWRRGNWQQGFGQRFGRFDHKVKQSVTNSHVVWVHGVSVGEANIAINLVNKLHTMKPLLKFVVSSTTTTGMQQYRAKLPSYVTKIYYPFDLRKYVSRALGVIRPELVILVEAEIWPNFLWRARRRRIPVMLVNARISRKSFQRYKRFGFLFRPLFQQFAMVGAQNEEDRQRLIELGCRPSVVHVTGAMKFDMVAPPPQVRLEVPKLLELIGVPVNTPVLLAGSTHAGEEKIIARLYQNLKRQFPSLFLILVPRHFERCGAVGAEIRELGIPFHFRTELSSMRHPAGSRTVDCLIVNSTGELVFFYEVATVVFIGKSLCGEGGQNPIEPASMGLPVVFGPNMQNFSEIAAALAANGAAIQVKDEVELERAFEKLLLSPSMRHAMGSAAIETTRERQGALGKTLDLIEKYFPEIE